MKAKTAYVCSECGYDTPKWQGRCPKCGEWNTFKEITVAPARGRGAAAGAAPALAG
ncbi:MAG: DNA repair protein RadA, partial [Bacteroidaceae bacterium]|nr:DNA repair protein RadA [Bacteroidaceae bacterium]